MPKRVSFGSQVETAVNEVLGEVPSRLHDSLCEVTMLEETLVRLLEEVREKKKVLTDAVNDFGAP